MDKDKLIALAQLGDQQAMNTLVEENSRLIWSIVHRFKGRGVEVDDLYQIGSMGFIKAVRGYDAAFGTEFSTYAVPKIMGEIRRFLRDDGMIKVSRDVRQQAAMIHGTIARLAQENGGEVHVSEVAMATGLSVEEIAYAQCAASDAYSLEAPIGEDGLSLGDTISEKSEEESIIDKLSIKSAVESLPEKEKMVIMLRFFKDLTQQKTADILGISQVQVSRTEKKAIALMRKHMAC